MDCSPDTPGAFNVNPRGAPHFMRRVDKWGVLVFCSEGCLQRWGARQGRRILARGLPEYAVPKHG